MFLTRNGIVADLMFETAKKIKFETTSRHLRLLEVACCKINHVISDCVFLETLNPGRHLSYRVEEIPCDQVNMKPNEFLLSVAHFEKDLYQTFGVPFLLKVKDVSVGSGFKLLKLEIYCYCLLFPRTSHSSLSRSEFKRCSTFLIKSLKR